VSFLGYSQQSENMILVYEFMHNGALKQHLPGKSHVLTISKIVIYLMLLLAILSLCMVPYTARKEVAVYL
jgi:hypothetical protein